MAVLHEQYLVVSPPLPLARHAAQGGFQARAVASFLVFRAAELTSVPASWSWYVGIICACLPSLRVFAKHHFPMLFNISPANLSL